jgi:toxin ParE1/3/4
MRRLILSPRAQADIEDIWNYSTERCSRAQAEFYLRGLERSMKMLVADPHLGRDCGHIRDGYRKYASGSHVLFYRLADDGVDIVRILHERMDFGRHL